MITPTLNLNGSSADDLIQPRRDAYYALQAAIKAINAAGGNAAYLDMRGPPNAGCGGHPGVLGHKGMFEMAQPVIARAMGW